MKFRLMALTAIGLILAGSALAEGDEHRENEHREAEAHVHGESVLNVAIEGNEISMELAAPGMDIVGFEYEPESDADREAVEVAVLQLSDADALFAFNEEAGCEVSEVDAHRGEEDMHDEDHGHEDDEHDGEETHSSFHAEYVYECQDIDALSSVEFGFFDVFENAERVEMQIVSQNGAGVIELSRDNPVAELN